MKKETSILEDRLNSSKIINFYFIYKLLKEIAHHCQQKIEEDLSASIFRNLEEKYSQIFASYIIEKHEVLSLKYDEESSGRESSKDTPLALIMERMKATDHLKWR